MSRIRQWSIVILFLAGLASVTIGVASAARYRPDPAEQQVVAQSTGWNTVAESCPAGGCPATTTDTTDEIPNSKWASVTHDAYPGCYDSAGCPRFIQYDPSSGSYAGWYTSGYDDTAWSSSGFVTWNGYWDSWNYLDDQGQHVWRARGRDHYDGITNLFRAHFTIPAGRVVAGARVTLFSDNDVSVWINGVEVVDRYGGSEATYPISELSAFDVGSDNVLAIQLSNDHVCWNCNPLGMQYRLEVQLANPTPTPTPYFDVTTVNKQGTPVAVAELGKGKQSSATSFGWSPEVTDVSSYRGVPYDTGVKVGAQIRPYDNQAVLETNNVGPGTAGDHVEPSAGDHLYLWDPWNTGRRAVEVVVATHTPTPTPTNTPTPSPSPTPTNTPTAVPAPVLSGSTLLASSSAPVSGVEITLQQEYWVAGSVTFSGGTGVSIYDHEGNFVQEVTSDSTVFLPPGDYQAYAFKEIRTQWGVDYRYSPNVERVIADPSRAASIAFADITELSPPSLYSYTPVSVTEVTDVVDIDTRTTDASGDFSFTIAQWPALPTDGYRWGPILLRETAIPAPYVADSADAPAPAAVVDARTIWYSDRPQTGTLPDNNFYLSQPNVLDTPTPSPTPTPWFDAYSRNESDQPIEAAMAHGYKERSAAWMPAYLGYDAGSQKNTAHLQDVPYSDFLLHPEQGAYIDAGANAVVKGATPLAGTGTLYDNGSTAHYLWNSWNTGRRAVKFIVATYTPTPTPTPTPTGTPTITPTPTPTNTPTPTPSPTPTNTSTPTTTSTPANTPTATATAYVRSPDVASYVHVDASVFAVGSDPDQVDVSRYVAIPIQVLGRFVPAAEIVSEAQYFPPPPTPQPGADEVATHLVQYRVTDIERLTDPAWHLASPLPPVSYRSAPPDDTWPRAEDSWGALPFVPDEYFYLYPPLPAIDDTNCVEVVTTSPKPAGTNPETRCVTIDPLPPGVYRVTWQLYMQTRFDLRDYGKGYQYVSWWQAPFNYIPEYSFIVSVVDEQELP